VDDEYWRGYDAAKLQGAAAENELRQKLERLTAERDEALGRADKLRGHLEAALRRWRTWRERARQAEARREQAEAENARLKAALEQVQAREAALREALREIAEMTQWEAEAGASELAQAALRGEGREDCKQCGGTGKVHSHNDICWVCDGTGKQPQGREGAR
jgi:DNA repair exonuclease SbcCD ATPase subunit